MSTRFSSVFSTLRSAFLALVLVCTAVPAWAQYDAITREAQEDPFILVRLAALSLETPKERGEALSGLVEAELARERLKDALEELDRIEDPFWRATALYALALYDAGKERRKEALKALGDANGALKGKLDTEEKVTLIGRIAASYAKLGNAKVAIAAAKRIPERMPRIRRLLDIGLAAAFDEAGRPVRNVKTSAVARQALAEAYRQTRGIEDNDSEKARLLLYIGDAQLRLGDRKNSALSLGQARKMIRKKTFAGRDEALAALAAAETEAGDQSRAMRLVHSISDPERRVRALGSVARAIGEKGNMDAAVTLFTLASETTERIDDKRLRYELLTHLVVEESRVGRLADAFRTAGQIRDRKPQAEALMAMGDVLLKKRKYEEALKLTGFIPYLGMRAHILAEVAEWKGAEQGDPVAASALLARALEPMGEKSDSDRVEAALERVLDVQIDVGDPKTSEALFKRADTLIQALPKVLDRVRLLTLLARAYARSGDPDRASAVIKAAQRATLDQRNSDEYPRSAARIVEALLATNQILDGFNAAVRIPEISPAEGERMSHTPRNRSLRDVAQAAARSGKPQLAIRAARKIRDPASRAAALAAVARGMAEAE